MIKMFDGSRHIAFSYNPSTRRLETVTNPVSDSLSLEENVGSFRPNTNFQGKIAVFAIKMDGRGDVTGGHKLLKIVKEILPLAQCTFSIIEVDFDQLYSGKELEEWKATKIYPLEAFTAQKELEITDPKDAMRDLSQYHRIILYPTDYPNHIPEIFHQFSDKVIKINEYMPRDGEMTFGFNYKQGVPFSDALNAFYKSHKHETRLERLGHLRSLPQALVRTILRKDISQSAIEEFHQTDSLFYGYGSLGGVLATFTEVLACIADKNITVCLLTAPFDIIKYLNQQRLAQHGFSQIVICNDSNIQTMDTPPPFKGGAFFDKKMNRCFRVIFTTLPHHQALELLWASEEEVLTFGQESFLESLMFRKRIASEFRGHRRNMMKAFATSSTHQLKVLMLEAFFTGREKERIIDTGKLFTGIYYFFQALRDNPHLAVLYKSHIQYLYDNHHFKTYLKEVFDKTLDGKEVLEHKEERKEKVENHLEKPSQRKPGCLRRPLIIAQRAIQNFLARFAFPR